LSRNYNFYLFFKIGLQILYSIIAARPAPRIFSLHTKRPPFFWPLCSATIRKVQTKHFYFLVGTTAQGRMLGGFDYSGLELAGYNLNCSIGVGKKSTKKVGGNSQFDYM
jgi:hypothetical protein